MVCVFVPIAVNSKRFDTNIQTNDSICNRKRCYFYFAKNSFKNLNQMVRVCPSITYNIGKFFTIGLDYELTGAQYGDPVKGNYTIGGETKTGNFYNSRGLATDNLHWIWNHRVQAMFKFSF